MKKIFAFFLIAFIAAGLVLGASCEKLANSCLNDNNKDDCEEAEKVCMEKIANAQGQEKTLASEIAYMDGQLNLTELRIQNSTQKIAKTTKEIEKLSGDIVDIAGRIGKLEFSITYQRKILNARLRSRYKIQEASPVIVLFGAKTFNQLVQRAEYLQVMELQDNKLLKEMADTKDAYNKQKGILEDTKATSEKLKVSLIAEKANLDAAKATLLDQQQEKKNLLEETQNNEVKYQSLLDQARAELQAMEGIVSSINFKNGSKVTKGTPIAFMGNSGAPHCSTGAHLHFEVRKNGVVVNAEGYLKPSSLYVYDYSTGTKTIGAGNWSWPMKNPQITQRFGKTPWSWVYPSGKHDGIDMVASNTVIYAPADGTMIKSTQGCYGSTINYVAIDHGGGVVSYYLHVQ